MKKILREAERAKRKLLREANPKALKDLLKEARPSLKKLTRPK